MARFVSESLPDDALALLRPGNLDEKQGRVVQIITVDDQGWANAGMLGYADRHRPGRRATSISPHGATANAPPISDRNGRITLLVIDEDMAYYVKGPRPGTVQVSGDVLTDVNDAAAATPHSPTSTSPVWREYSRTGSPPQRCSAGVTFEGLGTRNRRPTTPS